MTMGLRLEQGHPDLANRPMALMNTLLKRGDFMKTQFLHLLLLHLVLRPFTVIIIPLRLHQIPSSLTSLGWLHFHHHILGIIQQ
jgi:hypothetical protein